MGTVMSGDISLICETYPRYYPLSIRTIVALGWVTVRPVTGELTRVTLRQLFLSSLTKTTTQMLPNILSFLKENLARVIAMPVVGR